MKNWHIDHYLLVDAIVAVAMFLLCVVCALVSDVSFSEYLSGKLFVLYGIMAVVCASLIGFSASAILITVLVVHNNNLTFITKNKGYGYFYISFTRNIKVLGTALVVSLCAFVASDVKTLFWLCLFYWMFAAVTTKRSLQLLILMVALHIKSESKR